MPIIKNKNPEMPDWVKRSAITRYFENFEPFGWWKNRTSKEKSRIWGEFGRGLLTNGKGWKTKESALKRPGNH